MLQLSIIGNVGADPQSRKSTNGTELTTFSVAISQKDNTTFWVSVVVSGHPKVVDFIKKGRCVFVQGNAEFKVYNGQPSVSLYSQRIELAGRGDEQTNNDPQPATTMPQDDGKGAVIV